MKNPRNNTYIVRNKLIGSEITLTCKNCENEKSYHRDTISVLGTAKSNFFESPIVAKFILIHYCTWERKKECNTAGRLRWALICTSVLMLYKSRNTSTLVAIKSYRCFLAICWDWKRSEILFTKKIRFNMKLTSFRGKPILNPRMRLGLYTDFWRQSAESLTGGLKWYCTYARAAPSTNCFKNVQNMS